MTGSRKGLAMPKKTPGEIPGAKEVTALVSVCATRVYRRNRAKECGRCVISMYVLKMPGGLYRYALWSLSGY